MLFRFLLWWIGFLLVAPVWALQENCENQTDAFLWPVQGKESVLYLYGSIHLGEPGFYPLPSKVEAAFRDADYLVFEVNPEQVNEPSVAAKMQRRGTLPPNQSLSTVLSKPVMNDLKKALRRMGVKPDDFMQFQPWFVTLMLTNLQMMSLGYQPQYGVENYIMRERNQKSKILSLESLDSQMDLLEELNNEEMLAMTLAQIEDIQLVRNLMNAWHCGDKSALSSLFESGFSSQETGVAQKKLDAIKQGLIIDRNKQMARKLDRLLNKGKGQYFVVVGAAHFLGEDSIITFLKEKGHKLQ